MVGFQGLSEDERWVLAFFVSTLASSEADLLRGAELWQSDIGRIWFPDLASLVTQTANDVRTTLGDDAVRVFTYLRQHPEAVMSSHEPPLMRSARLIREVWRLTAKVSCRQRRIWRSRPISMDSN